MRRWLGSLLALMLALVLAGCGGGVGSGGTGIDPGSGGTGSPMSYTVGAVQGFGSIIVNGTRYETGDATFQIEDTSGLKLGMTVQVFGTVTEDAVQGTATLVVSAADLRGTVQSVDAGSSTFVVLGMRVAVDEATVFEGASSAAQLQPGDPLQIWGLPGTGGELRATRIEKLSAPAAPITSGAVEQLDTAVRTFRVGALVVDYTQAVVEGQLAPGLVVRVRGTGEPAAGVLRATSVEPWSALPEDEEVQVDLGGVVTEFAGLDSFKLAGTPVRAGLAQVSGGPASAVGNGVKLAATGHMVDGVLVASRLTIQHVPGTGGPVSFSVSGPVANYQSAASFTVQGQRIDASGPDVAFTGGTAPDLRNGRQVSVQGSQVVDGVLIAREVAFQAEPGAGDGGNPGNSPNPPPAPGPDPAPDPGPEPGPAPEPEPEPQALTLGGPVANYQSASSFQVRNQEVNAGGSGVVFNGGTAADLRNGRQVTVTGTLAGGVLVASEVTFAP